MASRTAVMCALALALARPAAAQQNPPIRIALYAPWGGPSEAQARRTLIQNVAHSIEKTTGRPTEGRAFAKYKDFEAALAAKQVDIALVDSVLAGKLKLIGAWTSGRAWAVLSRDGGRLPALRGRKLAVAAADAPTTSGFIERAMMRGQLTIKSFFGGTVSTPLPLDAVRAVALGKADCAIAPRDEAGALRVVFDLGAYPELALGVVIERAAALGPALPGVARSAVGSALGPGWSAESGGLRGEVALRRFVLAQPQPYNLRLRELFVPMEKSTSPMSVAAAWVPPTEEM